MKRQFSKEQNDYIVAKAALETVKDLDKHCRLRILKDNSYFMEGTKERILSPEKDFMMSERKFYEYCQQVHQEHKKAGLKPKDYNHVITYEYEEALRTAEFALIEWSLEVIKVLPEYKKHVSDIETLKAEIERNYSIRKKVVDMAMKLTA